MAVDILQFLAKKLARFPSDTHRIVLRHRNEEIESWVGEARNEILAREILESAQLQADALSQSINVTIEGFNKSDESTGKVQLKATPEDGTKGSRVAEPLAVQSPHHTELSEAFALAMKANNDLIKQSQGLVQQTGAALSAMAGANVGLMAGLTQRLVQAERERDDLANKFQQAMGFAVELESELKASKASSVKLDRLLGLLVNTPLVRGLVAEQTPPNTNANAPTNTNGSAKQ